MKNGERTRYMTTARDREAQYAEVRLREWNVRGVVEPDENGHKPTFRAWLRGKFGLTVGQRHRGDKPSDKPEGAPFTRVQHRTGTVARGKRT